MENEERLCGPIGELMGELIEGQQRVLFELGRRLIPSLTQEDMLQPNDFPILESHPEFRYEEGVLAGLMTAQMAIRFQTVASRMEMGDG